MNGKVVGASGILILTGLLVSAQPATAVPVSWLYDVDVAVVGRTEAARLAVSGAALAQVLTRVSGLAHVPRNTRVVEALRRPEAYYNRFVFLDDGKLRIHFVPGAILKLADEARLPVWSANRPRVMVWLVVESAGVRLIVDGHHLLGTTLKERARQRGIVLNLPLMDLEDRMRVQPSVVRGRLFSTLDIASRRYAADVILAGRVQERTCVDVSRLAAGPDAVSMPDGSLEEVVLPPETPAREPADAELRTASAQTTTGESKPVTDVGVGGSTGDFAESRDGLADFCGSGAGGFYAADLEAWMNGEVFATEFSAPDAQEAARMASDFIADELAGRFAVLARDANKLTLTIRDIDTAVGYGRLLRYFHSLEFVSSVDVTAVDADRLVVTLHTRAGRDQLVELFKADGLVRPDPTDEAVLTWQGP